MNQGLQFLMSIPMNEERFKIDEQEFIAKELKGEDFNKYQKEIIEFKSKDVQKISTEKVVSALVYHSIHNVDGSKVFGEKDRALVDQLPKHILDELFEHASKVNGMDTTQEENEKN